MPQVFLSYSTLDYFFAELAEIKLAEHDIKVWRDQGQLRAGADWRDGIETGIAESQATLVALSTHSAASPYVTFEWAYAIGKGKPIIPLRLNDCIVHPKLATIQHLDFSIPRALPWQSLIERIREIETDQDLTADAPVSTPTSDTRVKAILGYLNQRGYQMVSFDRIRRRIDATLTDQDLDALVVQYPTTFKRATLREGRPGLAKLVP